MSKPINISVPDDLHEKLKQCEGMGVSAICQRALQEAIEEWNLKSSSPNLERYGAIRLSREKEKYKIGLLVECREAGEAWTANFASLEELEEYENNGELDPLHEALLGNVDIPDDLFKAHYGDFFSEFENGVDTMWSKIKKVWEQEKMEE